MPGRGSLIVVMFYTKLKTALGASDAGKVRSPKRAIPMPVGLWSKAPGRTATQPKSVDTSNYGCANAFAAYEPAANTPTRWWSPWPEHWWAFCGPSPTRCR